MADSQDKRLPATGKKIGKARKDGQVARSRDLGHLVAFAAGGALIVGLIRPLTDGMVALLARGLRFDRTAVTDPGVMTGQLFDQGWQMLAFVLPLGIVMALVAVVAGTLSGGWNFTLKPIHPNFGKLNPLAGLGRMFSKSQLTPMLKACLLAIVLFAVGGLYLRAHLPDFAQLIAQPLRMALAGAGEIVLGGMTLMLLVLAVFAVIDVPLQRWLLSENLKMSHEEVKQEHKDAEGNTEVKGKIKATMRQRAMKRMLAAVPQADIVVMNPTHFAVALKYEEGGSGAPRVVAKGADLLAFKIRDTATAARVPVLQSPPLARALYAHCEIDQEIPGPLFAAVAQVLAWVFQLRAAVASGTALPSAPAMVPVPPEFDPLNRPERTARRRPGADT
ncbi:MAG: EscU/YscU/HrcU family type III secretion system export apparatus switch protein [Rubrivivax sp.]|nr:EscU/YscU/HrcU family type III secretion system export apparatus switch protein [Rubrivivax sp.]